MLNLRSLRLELRVIFELNLKVRRFDLLPTRRGLFVSHWTGDLEAELEWSPLPENLAFRLVVLSLH